MAESGKFLKIPSSGTTEQVFRRIFGEARELSKGTKLQSLKRACGAIVCVAVADGNAGLGALAISLALGLINRATADWQDKTVSTATSRSARLT
jgi:hypothetical protein